MKILVLGGTGAIGSHLVELLKNQAGYSIAVTSRSKRDDVKNIKYICGNAYDDVFISDLLKANYDVIVDFMSYKTESFRYRYSKFLEHCGQYVFLSSARVYADNRDKAITEESPLLLDMIKDKAYLRTDEYALTKARQENILRASHKNNYTIIRPYITYSENRLQLGVLEKEYWLYRVLHGRSIVFSNDIADKMTTLTYGKDVSRSICTLLGRHEAMGEAFHITGENFLKWSDVLDIYLKTLEKATGKCPRIVMTRESTRLKYPEAKWQVVYDRYFNRMFDNSKIGRFVNIKKFTTPSKGLTHCLMSFLNNPQFRTLNWKEEALYDAICHETAPSSESVSFQYKMYRKMPQLLLMDRLKQHLKMLIKG